MQDSSHVGTETHGVASSVGPSASALPTIVQGTESGTAFVMSALPVLSVDHADVTYQQAVNIIVDSGCCVHVCPPSFCKEVGFLQSSEQPPKLIAASWGNIATYGLRQVQMEVSGVPLMATFVVAAIRWPMPSVTRLPEKGWQVLLDARSMQVSSGHSRSLRAWPVLAPSSPAAGYGIRSVPAAASKHFPCHAWRKHQQHESHCNASGNE